MLKMANAMITISTDTLKFNDAISDSLVKRWLKFAGVSEKSIVTYTTSIKQMLRYFADNNITNPVRENLESWRDMLIDSGKSANTVRLYVTACKLFFRWLSQEEIYKNIADNLKSRVKISTEHKKDFLSSTQSRQLLNQAKGNGKLKDLRDRAIIALMLSAGLRTIEVVRADVKDIRKINNQYYLYVQGKGRSEKAEAVLLAPQVYSLIQGYLKTRGKVKSNEPLFTSTSNRCKDSRLDTQTIRKMVKFNLREIGLDSDRLTAHSLRHTAATTMLLNGVKLEQVQMILRHKPILVTQIYNHAISRLQNQGELIAANIFFKN